MDKMDGMIMDTDGTMGVNAFGEPSLLRAWQAIDMHGDIRATVVEETGPGGLKKYRLETRYGTRLLYVGTEHQAKREARARWQGVRFKPVGY